MSYSMPGVVLDLGECYSKIGVAGEDAPRVIAPSLYSNHSDHYVMWGNGDKQTDHYFGFAALNRADILPTKSLLGEGRLIEEPNVVGSYLHDMMVNYFETSETQDHSIIVSDKPNWNVKNRVELAEVLLDKNKFHKFAIIPDYVLSLYSTGKTTGTVLSCGYGTTYAGCVYNGLPMLESIQYTEFTSKVVEQTTRHLLHDLYYRCPSNQHATILFPSLQETRLFLEKNILVNQADLDLKTKKVRLPDGNEIEVSIDELSSNIEPYFLPENGTKNGSNKSLQDLLRKAIDSSPMELRESLSSNIILEGGITRSANFYERLYEACNTTGKLGTKLRLNKENDRLLAPWIGASKLKDWLEDNKLFFDAKSLYEKGVQRAMKELTRSY
jgi:centractin